MSEISARRAAGFEHIGDIAARLAAEAARRKAEADRAAEGPDPK